MQRCLGHAPSMLTRARFSLLLPASDRCWAHSSALACTEKKRAWECLLVLPPLTCADLGLHPAGSGGRLAGERVHRLQHMAVPAAQEVVKVVQLQDPGGKLCTVCSAKPSTGCRAVTANAHLRVHLAASDADQFVDDVNVWGSSVAASVHAALRLCGPCSR